MFFIMGMSQGQKQLDFNQTMICGVCGSYGRYEVFMTYMYFSFFFIPLFKWNKRYYVQTSCCGSVYELDPQKGRMIEYGQQVTIGPGDMILRQNGTGRTRKDYAYGDAPDNGYSNDNQDTAGYNDRNTAGNGGVVYEAPPQLTDSSMKKCPSCGYPAAADFDYCPKCGRKL